MQTPPDVHDLPIVHSRKKLARATLIAAGVAALLLVTVIVPAEYGADPLGTGRALGLTRFGDDGVTVAPLDEGTDVLYSFTLGWQIEEASVLRHEGSTSTPGAETDLPFPFNGTNLTQMTASLAWSDDDHVGGQPTGPDTFEIQLRGPDGRSFHATAPSGADGDGEASVTYPWTDARIPRADDGFAVNTSADTSAQGDWTARVRALEMEGNGAGPDPGNAWTLTVRARTYGLANVASFGSEDPLDRVVLGLSPGGSVEYKLRMAEGAGLGYRWTSDGAVEFDFHGDTGPAEEPTSHKQGTANGDAGEFIAPFAGRHGWHWRNAGDTPVRITLEMSGDYEILGVV